MRDLVRAPAAAGLGGGRLVLFGGGLILGALLFWSTAQPLLAAAALLLAGVSYALLLITTHDAVHGTLLGRPRLEFALACLISWPMAWPFATYASLHRLHHRWNGRDRRDPERVEPLGSECRRAGALRRWHQCHPFWGRVLLLGGLGLIADTAHKGWQLRHSDGWLPARLLLDGVGVLAVHAAMLTLALAAGVVGRYLLFWLVLERTIGAIVQTRGLIEHHGLWRTGPSGLLTQLYASATVTAPGWLNIALGGLPHHAAHHAFPSIPFQRLPLATERISEVLASHQQPPLPRLAGYRAAVRELL